ncbi:MAG: hypothetical protein H7Y86_20610 [Rhizobacter sp.]|nr:hypothetical protein [Ferruginibacter sp.]
MARTIVLFIYIILSIYCFGACMMDYFGIYEPWKLIDADDFAAFHQYQGSRIIGIFVIPSGVMTLFGVAACIFPVKYVQKKWLWLSMLGVTFDWIFSFTMQIPIQLELETRKDLLLIDELLYTNWFRYLSDVFQVIFVLVILWQIIRERSIVAAKISHR